MRAAACLLCLALGALTAAPGESRWRGSAAALGAGVAGRGGRCAEAAAEPHGNGAPAPACAPGARAQPGDSASPLRRRRRAGDGDSGAAGPEPLRGAREHQALAAGLRRGRRRAAVAAAEHAGAERGGAGTGKPGRGDRGRQRGRRCGASPHPPPGCSHRPGITLCAERCSARRGSVSRRSAGNASPVPGRPN